MINWRCNWSFRSHWWRKGLWASFLLTITKLTALIILNLLLLVLFLLNVIFTGLHLCKWVIFTSFTTSCLRLILVCSVTWIYRGSWSWAIITNTHVIIHLVLWDLILQVLESKTSTSSNTVIIWLKAKHWIWSSS